MDLKSLIKKIVNENYKVNLNEALLLAKEPLSSLKDGAKEIIFPLLFR